MPNLNHLDSPYVPPFTDDDRRRIHDRAGRIRRRRRGTALGATLTAVALAGSLAAVVAAPAGHGTVLHPAGSDRTPPVSVVHGPTGWVPVSYGDAEIWVPPDTRIFTSFCIPESVHVRLAVVLGPGTAASCAGGGGGGAGNVMVQPESGVQLPKQSATSSINGIPVWPLVGSPAMTGYNVASLGVQVTAWGSAAQPVLATLTHSPSAVATAPGSAPAVPSSWHRVTVGPISVAVPAGWPVRHRLNLCLNGPLPQRWWQQPAVVVDPTQMGQCFTTGPFTASDMTARTVVVQTVGAFPAVTGRCFSSAGARICAGPAAAAEPFLRVSVQLPGGRTVGLRIGLSGNGMEARTILRSLRPPAS